jgi:hypothetical protein
MTRETRANLIFLAVILAILTPGALILFRKKLAPTLKPMGMPEPVPTEIAYLSPLETPPGRKRIEPPHTAKWVESLVRERIGARRLSNEFLPVIRAQNSDGLPAVSDRKTFQVIATSEYANSMSIWVLIWQPDPSPLLDAQVKWHLRNSSTGETVTSRANETQRITVPPLVREELGEFGVLRPPHEVVWQHVELIPKPAVSSTLHHTSRGQDDFVNFAPSFTNSATTGN